MDIENANTRARYVMRKLVALEAAEVAAVHPWINEADRWKELVFALLVRIGDLPEPRLRGVVDALQGAGLLDIAALAGAPRDPQEIERPDSQGQRVCELLGELGFGPGQARTAFLAMAEAAAALQLHFGGKVQRYLRLYGEKMLAEVPSIFAFTAISDAQARLAFAYWLQNVASLPVSLPDEEVEQFCAHHGVTLEQWLVAADELDINLALLDDLVHCWGLRRSSAAGEPAEGGAADKGAGHGQRG